MPARSIGTRVPNLGREYLPKTNVFSKSVRFQCDLAMEIGNTPVNSLLLAVPRLEQKTEACKHVARRNSPIMQDLSNPKSLISQAFSRFTPPTVPFEPDGRWTHVYQDSSSHGSRTQGELTIAHRPGGKLRIENYRSCGQGYLSYTLADLTCNQDLLRSPRNWRVETKVSKSPDAPAYMNSGLVKTASVADKVLAIRTAGNTRTLSVPGPYTCKWVLLDAVGRMATRGTTQVTFDLFDEYDELCPQQAITFTGDAKAKTRKGMIDIKTYQHTGTATMPGVFYVDAAGRVLFYLAGMQLLTLTKTIGAEK